MWSDVEIKNMKYLINSSHCFGINSKSQAMNRSNLQLCLVKISLKTQIINLGYSNQAYSRICPTKPQNTWFQLEAKVKDTNMARPSKSNKKNDREGYRERGRGVGGRKERWV